MANKTIGSPTPNITRNLEPGMSGADVKELQEWLKLLGFFPKDQQTTNYYGDITKNAVAQWQQAIGLDPAGYPGYFGPKSRGAMDTTIPVKSDLPVSFAPGTGMVSTVDPNSLGKEQGGGSSTESQNNNQGGSAGQQGTGGSQDQGTGDTKTQNTPPAENKNQGGSEEFKSSPYYIGLTDENKQVVDYFWDILSSQNTEKQEAFKSALDLASKQANPYWQEKAFILKDELSRAVATTKADADSLRSTYLNRKSQIEDDLKYNSSYLSAEEQAELSRAAKQYEVDAESLMEAVLQSGTESSSIRSKAESRLKGSYEDTVESSTRKYAKSQRDLTVDAQRKVQEIDQSVADLTRHLNETLTSKVRTSEQYLGSQEIGSLGSEYQSLTLGGLKGTMATEKATDILNRTKGLFLTGLSI